MGKSRKRKPSESEDLRHRIKRLERRLEKRSERRQRSHKRTKRSHSRDKTEESQGKENVSPNHPQSSTVVQSYDGRGSDEVLEETDKPNEVAQQDCMGGESQVMQPSSEQPKSAENNKEVSAGPSDGIQEILDEEALQILGEDPSENKVKELNLHPSIASRWKAFIASGQPKEVTEELLKKYPRTGNCNLEAPKLNGEIEASINDAALIRDKKFVHEQNLVGAALAALGTGISMILRDEKVPIVRPRLLECLSDAGRLLADLHHSESKARKAFILPGVSKQIKQVLESANTSTLLFGDELANRIKEAKTIEKLGQDMKPQQPVTQNKKSNFKPRTLNWRGPPAKRQGTFQMGNKQKFSPRQFQPNQRNRPFQPQSRPQNTPRPPANRPESNPKS